MNQNRRWSAAALVLVLCLTFASAASAESMQRRTLPGNPREKIVRIIDIIKKFIGDVVSQDDFPLPPRP
jgi:hypothetical protein